MNLLSIGASLGIVVAVFQWGWLGSLFGIAGGPIARLPARDGVRDRVRALDGLRGLPRQPHPRGVDARRRQLRPSVREGLIRTGPRDHGGRGRDGRRLRELHRRRATRDRAVRARARRRRVPRRARHPRPAAARDAPAPRRAHLVVPATGSTGACRASRSSRPRPSLRVRRRTRRVTLGPERRSPS